MKRPRHRGQFVSIDGIDAHPRPIQRPGPPIVVGDESRTALRRAITMADGWYGFYLDPSTVRNVVHALRRLAEEHERPAELGALEITVTPSPPINRGTIEQYHELGVERLVFLPQPDAGPDERHRPVPLDRIKQNIDVVAQEFAS